MLLNAWATNLADFVMLKAKVPLQRRSVFVYGCELMLSTCASILSIIVISILVRAPYSSITFLFVFMGIRFFSGGLHAATYLRCFILTNTVYLLTLLIASFVVPSMGAVVQELIVVLSTAIIIVLAPVRHKNHPLSELTYRRNKKIARAITLAISSIIIIFLLNGISTPALAMAVVTLMAVAIMIILPNLRKGAEES